MSDNQIIVFGSARVNGHTAAAVKMVTNLLPHIPVFNLADYAISDFDYQHDNIDDDFLPLLQKLLRYDTVILATPVYWYTMSAVMKRFVDRLSDLLSVKKDLGRLLRGKNLAVITAYGVYPEGKEGFEPIFVNIANYLGMNYLGCYFYCAEKEDAIRQENMVLAEQFVQKIRQNNPC